MNLKACTPVQLAWDLLPRCTCKVCVAAVLSDSHGRIFGWGWNSGPTIHDKGIHAEAHAFSRVNRARLYGATLTVVAKRRKSGSVILARPCERCMPLVRKYGIKRIVYTTKTGWETLLLNT